MNIIYTQKARAAQMCSKLWIPANSWSWWVRRRVYLCWPLHIPTDSHPERSSLWHPISTYQFTQLQMPRSYPNCRYSLSFSLPQKTAKRLHWFGIFQPTMAWRHCISSSPLQSITCRTATTEKLLMISKCFGPWFWLFLYINCQHGTFDQRADGRVPLLHGASCLPPDIDHLNALVPHPSQSNQLQNYGKVLRSTTVHQRPHLHDTWNSLWWSLSLYSHTVLPSATLHTSHGVCNLHKNPDN
jgi:hypothetical protein